VTSHSGECSRWLFFREKSSKDFRPRGSDGYGTQADRITADGSMKIYRRFTQAAEQCVSINYQP
jgi:hypothetical protein